MTRRWRSGKLDLAVVVAVVAVRVVQVTGDQVVDVVAVRDGLVTRRAPISRRWSRPAKPFRGRGGSTAAGSSAAWWPRCKPGPISLAPFRGRSLPSTGL